jgi:hypothetical protein
MLVILVVCLVLFLTGKIPYEINMLFVILNSIVVIALALYMRWFRKQEMLWNSIEYRVNARIDGKRRVPVLDLHSPRWPPAGAYVVLCVFENGISKEIVVPENLYSALPIGQCGILTFRENTNNAWLIKFEPFPYYMSPLY